jgi:hypothetical protein
LRPTKEGPLAGIDDPGTGWSLDRLGLDVPRVTPLQ